MVGRRLDVPIRHSRMRLRRFGSHTPCPSDLLLVNRDRARQYPVDRAWDRILNSSNMNRAIHNSRMMDSWQILRINDRQQLLASDPKELIGRILLLDRSAFYHDRLDALVLASHIAQLRGIHGAVGKRNKE